MFSLRSVSDSLQVIGAHLAWLLYRTRIAWRVGRWTEAALIAGSILGRGRSQVLVEVFFFFFFFLIPPPPFPCCTSVSVSFTCDIMPFLSELLCNKSRCRLWKHLARPWAHLTHRRLLEPQLPPGASAVEYRSWPCRGCLTADGIEVSLGEKGGTLQVAIRSYLVGVSCPSVFRAFSCTGPQTGIPALQAREGRAPRAPLASDGSQGELDGQKHGLCALPRPISTLAKTPALALGYTCQWMARRLPEHSSLLLLLHNACYEPEFWPSLMSDSCRSLMSADIPYTSSSIVFKCCLLRAGRLPSAPAPAPCTRLHTTFPLHCGAVRNLVISPSSSPPSALLIKSPLLYPGWGSQGRRTRGSFHEHPP